MKMLLKKNFIIFLIFSFFSINLNSIALSKQVFRSDSVISNYFFSILSLNYHNTNQAYNYLKKAQKLNNVHRNYNINYIRTLVKIGNIKQAFIEIEKINPEYRNFNEYFILKGIKAFKNKNYNKSFEYFNKISKGDGNDSAQKITKFLLISLTSSLNKKENDCKNCNDNGFIVLKKLANINKALVNCHFDSIYTQKTFQNVTQGRDFQYSRLNIFLANYLLKKKKYEEAEIIIQEENIKNKSDLIVGHILNLLKKKDYKKIKEIFDCKNPKHILAEYFYIAANIFARDYNYAESNFYLQISLFLNNKFYTNQILMAENYFNLNKLEEATNLYEDIQSFGDTYFWYASKKLAYIKLSKNNDSEAIKYLIDQFKKIEEPSADQYYDLANFYKDNNYYEDSIKYYTLALNRTSPNNKSRFEIFDRRGTSYERLKLWEKAEKDLKISLDLKPDQPYVLNYLAYSWLERNTKIDKAYDMLMKANNLKKNDPYIIDSLGWCMYMMGNYKKAEEYLQIAVQLLPFDPIINDHYADSLWKLKKYMQARYFWSQIINFKETEEKLKSKIKQKLINGVIEES